MSSRAYKFVLLFSAVLLIAVVGFIQRTLNTERARLGLTRLDPLENAPPVLALTTQALGSFRGLIANALWIRASQLQDEDKYFEMVQLADWITKLEPHFVQVWLVQAWNMTYNISVKFTDYGDRWRWVQAGIQLLRDYGIRYNPDEALLYRELAWFFQHKMGQNLDDAHWYYKEAWASEMSGVLGGARPNFAELLNPTTDDAKRKAALLREKYKMDPAKIKGVDERFGPLDWRLPEAHAIYWATIGLEKSKPEQLITLRRVIYQSLQMSFQRGRLVLSSNMPPRLMPNLDIVEKANTAYEQMLAEETDSGQRDSIWRAHKNFLKDVPYQMFTHNRVREGERWLKYARQKYPDVVPANLTLAEYAVHRATEIATQEQSQVKITSLLEAFVAQSYFALLDDNADAAAEYIIRAREIRSVYQQKIKDSPRLSVPTIEEYQKTVRDDLLNPQRGLPPEARARLRTILGLPAETAMTTPPVK